MEKKFFLNRLKLMTLSIFCLMFNFSLLAQNKTEVMGVVTDSNGLPLPGVSVILKNTSKGVLTNIDGEFTINAPVNGVLEFSYIGMLKVVEEVRGQDTINITMQIDTISMDEVIVVGYGTQEKVNLTGSVSSIKVEEISSRPITNISSGLSGLAAGVYVSQNSGGVAGGDAATIRIRGVGTLNDSNPLVVVDGVPSEGITIMNDIDPNDIENISILKDAASASIYGSRGANGVIVITTKRGKSGSPTLTYNMYSGWSNITRKPDYVSDFATWMEAANVNRGTELFADSEIQAWRDNPNDPLLYPNVDWYEELTGNTAFMMNHNLAYSGGTDKTQYRFSLSYLDQEGVVSGNDYKRYSLRTNLSSEVAKGLKMGSNIFFRWSDLSPNILGNLSPDEWVPGMPSIQSPDGRWGGAQSGAVGTVNNSYAEIENIVDERSERRLLGDIFAELEIIPGLKTTAKMSLNYNQSVRNYFAKRYDLWDFRREMVTREIQLVPGRTANVSQSQNYLLTGSLLLEYNKSIDNHNFKILGGYESMEYRSENLSVTRQQFQNNEVQGINAGLLIADAGGAISEWAMQSYFGRLNYNYDDKYLIEANIRADGSSRFSEKNRWGYFPSFSVGWNIEKEDFMNTLTFINRFKIRSSWGQLGNNRIYNYEYQPTYAFDQNYSFNGTVYPGIAQTKLINEGIKWETTTTSNIGIDAGFFKNKLSVTFDYFIRDTDDILTSLPVPDFLGDKGNPTVNLASMRNKGFEVTLGHKGMIGELNYNISGNITQVENKVTDYLSDIVTGGTQVGYPFNSFYGYEAIDIFRTQEQLDNAAIHRNNTGLGDIEFRDQVTEDTDGDGVPDAGNGVIGIEDMKIIGNSLPKYTYGANVGLEYKGFDMNILVQGLANRDKNTLGPGNYPLELQDRGALPTRWLDEAWSVDNPNGSLPRLFSGTMADLNSAQSTFWVKDVSYLRVKNIQLGYNFSSALLQSKFISSLSKLRVYVSADNLLTFTNEEWGFDPETNNTIAIPNIRTVIVGLNMAF